METIKDKAAYLVQSLEVLNNSTEQGTDTAALVQYVLTTARDMVEELNKENNQESSHQESSTTATDKYFKRYYLRAEMEGVRPKIENSGDAVRVTRALYGDELNVCETFSVLFVDRAQYATAWGVVAVGGFSSCVVPVCKIATMAALSGASAVLLIHNHPSGDVHPSASDRKITERIKTALKLIDVEVIDHVIISTGDYYSFADFDEL